MISIISNHAHSMEGNENVMKRNNIKLVGKIIKRDEIRPTILAKPQKNPDVLNNSHNTSKERIHDDDEKQNLRIIRNSNKKDDQTSTKQINGYNTTSTPATTKTLYQTQTSKEQNQEKLKGSTNLLNNSNTPSNSTTSTSSTAALQPNTQAPQINSQNQLINAIPLSARLNTGPFLSSSVKLLDENLVWQDNLADFLHDQSDFLVVGIIGKQGVGKSTLMSLLAGNKFTDENRHMIFRPSGKDTRELAQHKTNGVQAFVTTERTILLDFQPLLSSSVLERAVNYEKKHSNYDFKYYENFIEIQSIELSCFALSVCDVVLVVEDWFTDPNLFRLIHTAEMLKPSMNASGTQEEYIDHHPHMVYILNKSDYIGKNEINKMKTCIDHFMKDSKIIYKDSLCELRNNLNRRRRLINDNINFVQIPKADGYKHDWHKNSQLDFSGLPSFEKTIKYLQREILSVKRNSYTNNTLFTEKKWFSYANKVWEIMRKSTLISEYNRLMT